MQNDTTDESLSDVSQLNTADDNSAVQQTSSEQPESIETLSLKELNEYLGKDFKDKGTAMKSLKDTFSYVGKKKEDIANEIKSAQQTGELSKEIKQIKENMFYKDNPELTSYRNLIQKLGDNPEDVVNMPEFKSIYEQAKGFNESQKLKTVLQSNPRIASQRDSLSKASEAFKSGNRSEGESQVAKAVLATLD